MSTTPSRGKSPLRVAPLMTSGLAVAAAGALAVMPAQSLFQAALAPAPIVQVHDEVALTANDGGIIGQFIGIFVGNGTSTTSPNAGILIGNGY